MNLNIDQIMRFMMRRRMSLISSRTNKGIKRYSEYEFEMLKNKEIPLEGIFNFNGFNNYLVKKQRIKNYPGMEL